jgi:fumarate hydratase, class I
MFKSRTAKIFLICHVVTLENIRLCGIVASMDTSALLTSMLSLIERTSTVLPDDVRTALARAYGREREGTFAHDTLRIILESADLSKDSVLPICQDTGSILAIVRFEPSLPVVEIDDAIRQAVRILTEKGVLRQNCVDPVTGENTGNNIGEHVPQIHFTPSDGPATVSLMLKGGGSENMSAQYSLPNGELEAGRDLDGVRKCILDTLFKAQGKGCAPGIIGVCIGGDRASGFLIAKEMLFSRLDQPNPSPELARLEDKVIEEANRLGIGPMGLGGSTTLLGARIGLAGRHPASFFVTVSYSCWATRRMTIELDPEGRIARWL